MKTLAFSLQPRGAFSLEPIRTFGCGLMVASRSCDARGAVTLAFPLDGSYETVGVKLRRVEDRIDVTATGTANEEAVRRQVSRILSVDHDGTPFFDLASQDPVLTEALKLHPGFRPPIFYSPYVAAGWLVLTQRLRQTQAAGLQARIARDGGDVAVIDGEEVPSFPRPETILRRSSFPGVAEEKWRRLQEVARAALEGQLELSTLSSLPHDEAVQRLRAIRGIGPWTAEGILMRGCGMPDAMTFAEPAMHHAIARGYGLSTVPSDEQLRRISDRWRPFRAWASVLLTMCYFDANAGEGPRGAVRGRRQPARVRATVA